MDVLFAASVMGSWTAPCRSMDPAVLGVVRRVWIAATAAERVRMSRFLWDWQRGRHTDVKAFSLCVGSVSSRTMDRSVRLRGAAAAADDDNVVVARLAPSTSSSRKGGCGRGASS